MRTRTSTHPPRGTPSRGRRSLRRALTSSSRRRPAAIRRPFQLRGSGRHIGHLLHQWGSLAQFNGSRYLQYRASFTTSDSTITPTLQDVTVCFTNVVNAVATTLAAAPAAGAYGGTANLSATLTANSAGLSGKTVDFTQRK